MSKLRIRSAGPSFRRAGIAATREGVLYDDKDLSKEQIEAIVAEPNMSIEEVDDADDSKSAKSGKGKK